MARYHALWDDRRMLNSTPRNSRESRREDGLRSLTSETFQALVLEADRPVAVEFMSYGCAHCRALEPILQEVAALVKDRETIFRVNIAVEQDLAASYEIQGTPTLILFLHGSEVGRREGPRPTVPSILAFLQQPSPS
jgi:thioredoxin 1